MSEKRIIGRAIQKHDIQLNWEKATNFTPMAGEIIVYSPDTNYTYSRIKIGDGKSPVNSLPFSVVNPVRGVDYWTEADKAEIKSYVDEAILGGAW